MEQIKGSISTENEINSNIQSTTDISVSLEPAEEISGSLEPTGQIEAQLDSSAEIDGSIEELQILGGTIVASRVYPVASTLASLGDTDINNPQADEVLTYDGTKWVNTEAPETSEYITSVSNEFKVTDGELELSSSVSDKLDKIDTDGTITSAISEAVEDKIDKPTTANTNDVLTYDGTNWTAQASQGGDTSECYKTSDNTTNSINDTDYIPLLSDGNKVKILWSKIKTVLSSLFMVKENAEGVGTFSVNADATGVNSIALGYHSTAYGKYSYTEGNDTYAGGEGSHAEGKSTHSGGNYSHAEGIGTKATGNYSHVSGKWNKEDTANKYAEIVGNGKSTSDRKDIRTLDWSGNSWYAGDVESATGGKMSEKISHHYGIIQSTDASAQNKTVTDTASGISVQTDEEESTGSEVLFDLRTNDLITILSEASNTYSATADAPVNLVINGENYKIVTYNNTVPTGTNTSYLGYGNRHITYRLDVENKLAHFFGKDWDNNTTYSFKTAYNSSNNKAVTETDITNAVNALDVSAIGGSGKYISTVSEADGKISATAVTIGTELTNAPSASDLPNKAYTNKAKITLTAGTWIVFGRGQIQSCTASDIRTVLSDASATSGSAIGGTTAYVRGDNKSGSNTEQNVSGYYKATANTDIYLNLYQNSGATVQARGWISAIKVG